MIEAHLERIHSKLDGLLAGQARLETRQENLEAGQTRLEAGHAKLETGLEEVRAGQISMSHEMRVLYEDAVDRVRALDPRPEIGTLRNEMAEAHQLVIRRLDVIEVAVRELWRRQAPQ